ncbi:MAG: MmoB/DmpM family protein [Pseudonocardiaceae bacterium]
MDNAVGPILRTSDEVDLVAAAISDDNPGTEIEVTDHGSYVRIHASGHLRVTEVSLKRYLGADFEIRSLEAMMSAFAGRIKTTSDAVEWSLGPAKAPVG